MPGGTAQCVNGSVRGESPVQTSERKKMDGKDRGETG